MSKQKRKKKKEHKKQQKRLEEFAFWVEHWRDRLSIETFDVYVEEAAAGFDPEGTLADISRDTEGRSALVRLYEHPPQIDVNLRELAKHELLHLLLADISALAHSSSSSSDIAREEEALVVRLCRLIE